MIQFKFLIFERNNGKYRKHNQCNHFLQNFQLKQIKRSAIFYKSKPVGRNLKNILKKSKSPTDQNNREKARLFQAAHFFHLQMSVPGECHENIRDNQKNNNQNRFSHGKILCKCKAKSPKKSGLLKFKLIWNI